MPALSLVLPGLLGPWPAGAAAALPGPAAGSLRRLLSRADVDCQPVSGFEATLCQLFGLTAPDGHELPVASLRRLSDGDNPDGYWLCADPVHLRADLHQVLLIDARQLAIEAAEAEQLAAEFNRTFAADGLQLDTPRPERWYLRLEQPAEIHTTPLAAAIGRDITALLPQGPAARRWHALLTEIQMLLHASPVNQARESAGRPTINGLWPWGGGVLPGGLLPPADEVYAADPLTRGLARQAGLAVQPPPTDAADWQAGEPRGTQLIVLDSGRWLVADGDFSAWGHWLETLERDWLAPLERRLRHGELGPLTLYPCDGRVFRISRGRLRRFWQRPRPLDQLLGRR